jgi:Survival motor neuron (SMN) interacting protein 1 (SIP1)
MYFTHWFNLYLESLEDDTDNKSGTCAYTPTDVHMRWVFALLTRIDVFCSADEISCLRRLARACLALISLVRRRKTKVNLPSDHIEETDSGTETKISETETNVAPHLEEDSTRLSECSMWVIFCAVTSIWGQRDLWNDAEESLSLLQSGP